MSLPGIRRARAPPVASSARGQEPLSPTQAPPTAKEASMSLHLSIGGQYWKLPKRQKPENVSEAIQTAMRERTPLTVRLDDGDTLILNGATLDYVVIFDDLGDPKNAFTNVVDFGSMISNNLATNLSMISSQPARP
jgi:hypothetical protein